MSKSCGTCVCDCDWLTKSKQFYHILCVVFPLLKIIIITSFRSIKKINGDYDFSDLIQDVILKKKKCLCLSTSQKINTKSFRRRK